MPSFLLFPRPIFFPSCAFLNSSPIPYRPLHFSSLINMNRNRQRGWFTNQYDTSPSSDSGTPHHHPNQDNSSVSVVRKNKTEPSRRSHQSGASPGIVEDTSSGNSQEKPVLVPRVVSQQMARSSYRGRPFVADSSSESAMRGDHSEVSHSRKGGWGPNSQMSSLKSNYVPVNRSDQDNSSAWVPHKNKTEPYRHPHQRGASPGTVEDTSSGNSQEKPVLVPRVISQQMARSSYRGRPLVADSSSQSAMRGDNSEISHSRKGGWGPNSQMSSLKSNYVPVNRRDQVNATHTEKHFPAAAISGSTVGQTSTVPEDGSSLHSHDSLHGSQAGAVVESPNRGQDVAGRQKNPARSRKVIPQSRSASLNMEYAYFCSTEAVIRPSEIAQNEIKEHGNPEHSKREIFQQRKSSPKRDYSHHGPGYADDMSYPPFDLFIQKPKTHVLKASLVEKNREKMKGRESLLNDPRPCMLRPGMVLLKNFITPDDQIKILKRCRDTGLGAGGFYQPVYTNGANMHLHMMCLGKDWDPQTRCYEELRSVDGAKPPIIPDDFQKLVNDAIQASHAMIGVNGVRYPDKAIPLMEPDICILNFYSNTGKRGLHQDRDESPESLKNGLPVVSFSIGDTAEFLYGEDRDVDKAEKIELKSGDVLIFGGKSRHIFHGVPSIIPNTAPKSLVDEVNLRPGRLNLTFRKY